MLGRLEWLFETISSKMLSPLLDQLTWNVEKYGLSMTSLQGSFIFEDQLLSPTSVPPITSLGRWSPLEKMKNIIQITCPWKYSHHWHNSQEIFGSGLSTQTGATGKHACKDKTKNKIHEQTNKGPINIIIKQKAIQHLKLQHFSKYHLTMQHINVDHQGGKFNDLRREKKNLRNGMHIEEYNS